MPRDGTQAGLLENRNTAAVCRGAHRADPSSVRNDGHRLTGDPLSRRTARWEIGASTCGPGIFLPSRSSLKVSSSAGRAPTGRGSAVPVVRSPGRGRGPKGPIVWLMSDTTSPTGAPDSSGAPGFDDMARDIAEVPAVEVIVTVAVNLMSAAAVKLGLTEEGDEHKDLDEARKLVHALAGLLDASATEISSFHAAPLRDGLKSLQLAFREASLVPDEPGQGPGEKYTGPVFG